MKKKSIASWFFGEIIPVAPPWKGLCNPTIILIYYKKTNFIHFFKNFSLKIANAFANKRKLSIILNKENPILFFNKIINLI